MDKALKQRLVGASVLIALAVIVLPMLLSGQAEGPQETRSIEVPPRPDELSFETRRYPVGQPGVTEPESRNNEELNVLEPAPMPTPDQPEPGKAEPPADAGQAQPEVMAETAVDTSAGPAQPGRYLVQVASFSTIENTNNLSRRLREDGLPVLLDTIEADAGILHRVRVGPFSDLAAANAALEAISGRTPDLNPRIIDLRPDEAAPVTEPSDPLVRWVVQAGSFAERENSDALVARLKEAGFPAYAVTVNEGSGIRYKVRIGPVIERQAALDIAADIESQLDLDGIVMSVD